MWTRVKQTPPWVFWVFRIFSRVFLFQTGAPIGCGSNRILCPPLRIPKFLKSTYIDDQNPQKGNPNNCRKAKGKLNQMAVLKFSEADRLSSIVVPTDWYTAVITEIDGPKKSSSEKSFNFFTKFNLTTKFPGKELQIVFNTGTKSPSILGSAQFMPTAFFMQLYAAAHNVSMAEVPAEFDPQETLVGKPFDIKVEKGLHDGVPLNSILAFLPAGKGADQQSPF